MSWTRQRISLYEECVPYFAERENAATWAREVAALLAENGVEVPPELVYMDDARARGHAPTATIEHRVYIAIEQYRQALPSIGRDDVDDECLPSRLVEDGLGALFDEAEASFTELRGQILRERFGYEPDDIEGAYRDPDWLNEHYNERHCSSKDIAAMCGVTTRTIRKWIRRHELESLRTTP